MFALKILTLCKGLQTEQKEFILSSQLLRSGTSIGANVAESVYAASKADFVNKLQIALKEANETKYWLKLMFRGGILNELSFSDYNKDINELIRILVASINTAKT